MDWRLGIGSLSCRLCGASYQMPIHHLHEPVDVFSEWLDDCEAAALGKPTGQAAAAIAAQEASNNRPEYDLSDDDDDDDLLANSLSNKKASKTSGGASSNKIKREEAPKATNYADLGLDDSDDDSD